MGRGDKSRDGTAFSAPQRLTARAKEIVVELFLFFVAVSGRASIFPGFFSAHARE